MNLNLAKSIPTLNNAMSAKGKVDAGALVKNGKNISSVASDANSFANMIQNATNGKEKGISPSVTNASAKVVAPVSSSPMKAADPKMMPVQTKISRSPAIESMEAPLKMNQSEAMTSSSDKNNVLALRSKIQNQAMPRMNDPRLTTSTPSMEQAMDSVRLNDQQRGMNTYHRSQDNGLISTKSKASAIAAERSADSTTAKDSLNDALLRMPNPIQPMKEGRMDSFVMNRTAPTFDLNQLSSGDAAKIVEQVSNYIMQSSVGAQQQVSMSFTHSDLGQVDLMVSKKKGEMGLDIQIATNTIQGADFFTKNQDALLSSLATGGIDVQSFKLETNDMTKNNSSDSDARQNFFQNQKGQNEQQQRRDDSERRKELWNIINNREAA